MASSDPLIGKVIGSYKVLGQLGKGGMGVVYKVQDMVLQRPAALKLLPQHLADDEDVVKRFAREARASARLNHPNIVTIYGVGRHENLYFIAMEYITGKPLDVVIKESGQLDIRRALDIVLQSADALAAAHGMGIIHRDIKPQNIMLDETGRVRVMDFGLALAGFESTKLTATGTTMGTPQYMSPEQWQDSRVDARSDIYSLGVTLYEMLAGGPPFDATTPLALMRKIVDETPPPVTQKNPNIPAALSTIVSKMIAKDVDDRYASAAELRDELAAYLGKAPMPSPPVAAPSSDFAPPGVQAQESRGDFSLPQVDPSMAVTTQSQVVQPAPQAPPVAVEEEPDRKMLYIGGGIAAAVLVAAVGLWMMMAGGGNFGSAFTKADFVRIEPGTFRMGSPQDEPDRENDETLHEVTLSKPFWIGKYEVTQAQWEDVMGFENNPSRIPGRDLPVENVKWDDAAAFIKKLNRRDGTKFRLPTEAEWEYACRGGRDTAYGFGDVAAMLPENGWFLENSARKTHPVGRKRPNKFGLYDMHGNVAEWTQDWADVYPKNPTTNPTGPLEPRKNLRRKMWRGGSYESEAARCRSAERGALAPDAEAPIVGLRLSLPIE